MFKDFTNLVIKFRILIVIFWVVAAGAMFFFAPSLSETGKLDQSAFLPANSESRTASEFSAQYFPSDGAGSTGALVFYNQNSLNSSDLAYAQEIEEWLLSSHTDFKVTSVTSIFTNPEISARLLCPDNTTMLMNFGLETTAFESESSESVEKIREYLGNAPQGLEVYVSGSAGIYSDFYKAVTDSIDITTLITIILIVVLLLIIYRSPIASLVPLFTIGMAYLVSRGILGLLAQAGISIWSQIDMFLVVLVFGAGTDYCLFMISRFREEIKRNDTLIQATKATIGKISAVITASAFAVIIGLSGMAIARYEMIKTMGPVLGIAIFVTLLASLTLTPALASLFGKKLFWPAHAEVKNQKQQPIKGFWARVARITTGHPVLVILVVIALMAVPLLALPGLNRSFNQLAELPPDSDSTTGFHILEDHFSIGEMDPLKTIVVAPEGGTITSPEGLAVLLTLGNDIRSTQGVSQVQSVIQPYGTNDVPAQFTVSGQLTSMVTALSGDTETSQPSADMSALGESLADIGEYLTELGKGFAWVRQENSYLGMLQATSNIQENLQALQSGPLQPEEIGKIMVELQQNLVTLGQQGTSLTTVFKSAGDPCFLPSGITSDPQTGKALQAFINENGEASIIYIVLDSSPQSNEALSTVEDVRKTIQSDLDKPDLNGYRVAVGGTTASLADVRTILDSDFTKVQIVVLCGIFVVFVLLLRSLVAPFYLLLTVILSYGTTLGLVTWIFQGMLGQDGISFIVPIVVFVLLVALGADYNIFLMSRVREESETKPTREATQTAAGITGSVITACGIILAGTFAALLVSPIRIMVQVGTTVAIGILIDTFIVRSLVVPAIATLVGRWNWWPSRLGYNNKK
jgi:RND superfamily putative drug exporter